MLSNLFKKLSTSNTTRGLVTHFGPVHRVARRFVAGETLDEAVTVVKELNACGLKAILNKVGEDVNTEAETGQAAKTFQDLLHRIHTEGLDSTISLKPSHLGMAFGRDFCYENIADIVQTARNLGITVEIDIEHSSDVEATLDIYHRLLDTFGGGIRLAIQSYLHRTSADLQRILDRGGHVRLVKGAYDEPTEIAYQGKEEIRQVSKALMAQFFTDQAKKKNAYLALGSHDPDLIEWLIRTTDAHSISRNQFEFQMLLGVRRQEQQRLADLGYQVRVYVPYGQAWYPYFMRRLAERPANVLFILRALVG